MKGNEILITGGAGFIGSHLVKRLAEDNEVTVFDDFSTGDLDNLEGIDCKIIDANEEAIPELTGNYSQIYHLGMPSSSPMYSKDHHLIGEVIYDFLELMTLADELGAKIVLASSSSVYNGHEPPHHESMDIRPTDWYTEPRIAMERLAFLFWQRHNIECTCLRFFSVYGPGEESKGIYANIVSQFMWQMEEGRSPEIYGDGLQSRDFIYVDDVIDRMIAVMATNGSGIFNVGTGVTISFNEVVMLLNEELGTEIMPTYIKNPISNYVPVTQADCSQLEELLGKMPLTTLREGIQKTIEAYMEEA